MTRILALAGLLLLAGTSSGAEDSSACLRTPVLERFAASAPIEAGRALEIVAIGSSSTAGYGASAPDKTYPALLEALLVQRFPVRVANLGMNGENALQAAERIVATVIPRAPHLVLWQLGTNDAIRDLPIEPFERAVDATLAALAAAGIDVVLIQPQWAPRVVAAPHLAGYLAAIDRAGAMRKVPVFRRFEIGRAEAAAAPHAQFINADRLHHTDLGYRCLAQQLAAAISDTAAMRVSGRPVRE